jgi:hypothetical protein
MSEDSFPDAIAATASSPDAARRFSAEASLRSERRLDCPYGALVSDYWKYLKLPPYH